MRIKHLLGVIIALSIGLAAGAVPAKPGPFPYTQPDGSVVMLERHGDEFLNWTTLYGSGQIVDLDANGFWRPSQISPARREAARQRRMAANEQRSSLRPARSRSNSTMTQGSRHIPVFLVEFPDKEFSLEAPAESFSAMLNQPGYSENGGTGSVRDYFWDNSHGLFQPIFDVYGPVMLPHEMAYYGKDDKQQGSDQHPELALFDACVILADQVDFSIYDADGDGFVDMTLFYYAGYSQAEGAPKDAIWPHQWSVQYSSSSEARNTKFNGKRLGDYFCTAELKGTSGTAQCGIGPTCHEFSHSLGLPDFYDTDYEDNGECIALGYFSLMDGGCYLNDSRTPPYLNAEERILLGWMAEEDMREISNGTVSFPSIQESIAYKNYTNTEGEYFVYECRDGSGWDSYLPKGMVVYHADKSREHRVGSNTAYDLWDKWRSTNAINAYGKHPCFYIVPASDQDNLNYSGSLSRWVFPGAGNVRTYAPKDWDGNLCGVSISDISYADGKVSLTAQVDYTRILRGKVTTSAGKVLAGVQITVSKVQDPSSGISAQIPLRIARRAPELSTYTDKDGCYEITLEDFEEASCHVTASLEGYDTFGTDVKLNKRGYTSLSITLSLTGQDDFQYYDEEAEEYFYGDGESKSLMAAIRIPADQLPAEGGEVVSVSFEPYWPASAYYIVVDSGEERVLTYRLPEIPRNELTKMKTVDLSNVVHHFPPGKDLYVGYAVQNAQIPYSDYVGYLFVIAPGSSNLYLSAFDLNGSNWDSDDEEGYALVLKTSIAAGKDKPVSFAQMGIPAIADPGKGQYTAGDAFHLQMQLPEGISVSSEEWFFDGKEKTGAKSVSLPAGSHTVTAVLHYADGSTETFDLVIDVN
jgi:M6 family metalloprotease-like protein